MKIACANGKKGTGKTTIATNLVLSIANIQNVAYFECDVEEPNGHIFLRPRVNSKDEIGIPLPFVDETNRCGPSNKADFESGFCCGTGTSDLPSSQVVKG